jgi:hypothetical protein
VVTTFCSLPLPMESRVPKNLACPFLALVMRVLSLLSVRCSRSERNVAISSLICSARLCGPHSPTTQSSAYRMYLTRIKFGSHTSTAGIDRICRIRSRHSFVSALLRFARSCFWAESCLWSGLGRFFLPEVSRCRISSIFSSSSWR